MCCESGNLILVEIWLRVVEFFTLDGIVLAAYNTCSMYIHISRGCCYWRFLYLCMPNSVASLTIAEQCVAVTRGLARRLAGGTRRPAPLDGTADLWSLGPRG